MHHCEIASYDSAYRLAISATFHLGRILFAYFTIDRPQPIRDLGNYSPLRSSRIGKSRRLLQHQALIKPSESTESKCHYESAGSGYGTC